jgi:hypothetical protein
MARDEGWTLTVADTRNFVSFEGTVLRCSVYYLLET